VDTTGPAAAPAAERTPAEQRRQAEVVLGLLLTIVGLFLASTLLPVGPAALAAALPKVGIALVTVWIGGVLLGGGAGLRRRRRRR
jgi:hypothetical protein